MKNYPDASIQALVGDWWVQDATKTLGRGRLIFAPALRVGQVPHELVPEGRSDAKDHTRAKARVQQFHIGRRSPRPPLPVAGLPLFSGEVYFAYKAKVRPAIILGTEPPNVGEVLGQGTPKTHRDSPLVIAPYYGADQSGTRAGFSREFISRVQRGEYPQYFWDKLPLETDTQDSLLRLDHIQPIGRSASTCKWTGWRLSEGALEILGSWITWLLEGSMPEACTLGWLREELMDLD
jgi:hypothetical protein